jgi:predicted  nucleic acid-binding Zn-ribbon protein
MNDFLDKDETPLLEDCPKCGVPYDDIDMEYQICSRCGFNADTGKFRGDTDDEDAEDEYPEGWPYDEQDDPDQQAEDNNPNDSRNL